MSKLGTRGDGVADSDERLISAGDSAESEGFACRGPAHLNDVSLDGQFILTVKTFEERLMPHAPRIFVESRWIDRKSRRVTLTHLIMQISVVKPVLEVALAPRAVRQAMTIRQKQVVSVLFNQEPRVGFQQAIDTQLRI